METRSLTYPTRNHGDVTVYLNHQPVARSKNLRGILDYARKIRRPFYIDPVRRASIFPVGAGKYPRADVLIEFCDGAICLTHFESYLVASHFVETRRSWNLRSIGGIASIARYAPR